MNYQRIQFKRKNCIFMFLPAIVCMTVYFMLPAYKPTITAEQLKKGLASVSRQLDCYSVRKWEYIVIHHSGTKSGNAGEFDKFHREKRRWKNGLGYHFVIGNGDGAGNGLIEIGDRWVNQQSGAHVGINKYNRYGIGICMVGNFNESYPTRAQMASLFVLTQYLQARCNISSKNIILHSDCKNTDCPGANFPYDKLFAQALP